VITGRSGGRRDRRDGGRDLDRWIAGMHRGPSDLERRFRHVARARGLLLRNLDDHVHECRDDVREFGEHVRDLGDHLYDRGDYVHDRGNYVHDRGDHLRKLGDQARVIEDHPHESRHPHGWLDDLVDVRADVAGHIQDLALVVEDPVDVVTNHVDVVQRSRTRFRISST
jgi:hypothetical protein